MGKRVVDDASLARLADAIRDKINRGESMVFPDEFESLIDEVFEAGKIAGVDELPNADEMYF